ncbi:MAG: GNAT family N-acetyltransferase [Limimaricola sp.]|uniref:GNAT family N-acetyltransferase n=1 Tax=Limimaricola sp. TaxID=2211665 RepID=UPI001D858F47|nr:GNAT family N-acetyltransferase [Limimaricola sp.]MBI1417983.1 GNAT family N-acetyltransferase [Limimaricola sp.]
MDLRTENRALIPPEIVTERLRLRPLAEGDLPWIAAEAGRWDVARWLTRVPHPYTLQDAADFLAQVRAGSIGAVWVITEGNVPVGVVSVGAELGYWLSPSAWGRGVMSEAAGAAVAAAFADPSREEIASSHFDENDRSRRVLDKLGFVETGRHAHVSLARGGEVPGRTMRLTRTAWAMAIADVSTARLTLRRNLPGDAGPMHAIASDWDVVRMLAGWPWPPDPAFTASRCEPVPYEDGLCGAVCRDGHLIGGMGIYGGKLGYMFARDSWGQGYATEMVRALVDASFARYDWDAITADVWADNPASARVLEKAGFRRIGTARRPCAARGADVDAVDFALSRADWRARHD